MASANTPSSVSHPTQSTSPVASASERRYGDSSRRTSPPTAQLRKTLFNRSGDNDAGSSNRRAERPKISVPMAVPAATVVQHHQQTQLPLSNTRQETPGERAERSGDKGTATRRAKRGPAVISPPSLPPSSSATGPPKRPTRPSDELVLTPELGGSWPPPPTTARPPAMTWQIRGQKRLAGLAATMPPPPPLSPSSPPPISTGSLHRQYSSDRPAVASRHWQDSLRTTFSSLRVDDGEGSDMFQLLASERSDPADWSAEVEEDFAKKQNHDSAKVLKSLPTSPSTSGSPTNSKRSRRTSNATVSAGGSVVDSDGFEPPRNPPSEVAQDVLEGTSQALSSSSSNSGSPQRWHDASQGGMSRREGDLPANRDPGVGTSSGGRKDQARQSLPPPPMSIKTDNTNSRFLASSIVPTPVELYPSAFEPETGLLPRYPLAALSINDGRSNGKAVSGSTGNKLSSKGLVSIPEDVLTTISGDSAPPSGAATPRPTTIRLGSGSVLTLNTPETTAWHQRPYISGPIKLPVPPIVPRKGSLASLDPFLEAIDDVYQLSLIIPRRRSDETVVDEICDFFDEFGFAEVAFGGDLLAVHESQSFAHGRRGRDDMVDVSDPTLVPPSPTSSDASSTPSPVEMTFAREVVKATIMPRAWPVPQTVIPPVQDEATLRAKGIARLITPAAAAAVKACKDSHALPLVPAQETGLFAGASVTDEPKAKRRSRPLVADQGFDWDDQDVDELDATSVWVAPAALPKPRIAINVTDLSGKDTKNPVKKMRRFVATASAIL